MLVLGGGSNLVIADEGFDGLVVEVATSGVTPDTDDREGVCGGVMVRVAAGETWDDFVATAVERGWVGVEALSGIPGSVGATPIQNVGAYGQEVAQTIASVRVWDRTLKGVRTFAAADCGFGYRHSRFKADPSRHVVLTVDFQLRPGTLGAPVEYAELARTLGVEVGQRAPLADVRRAVLGVRAGKGMVLDAGRPRHVERGLVLHQPVPHARAGRRAARRRTPLAAARRHRQDERGLADRARRLRQGLRPRLAGSRCRPSTRSRSPTAARPRPTSCSRWRARSATGWSRPSAYDSSTSRCSSAAASSAQNDGSDV